MNNIREIKFYNKQGIEDEEGTSVVIDLKKTLELTMEEENYIFDEILKHMQISCALYYYIEYFVDGINNILCDDTSFLLAKKLNRIQEIKDMVNSWFN
jgi:hypothetical protein